MLNKKHLSLALLLSVIAGQTSQLSAANANVDWRNNRILPLEKVTVGPTDNYQAVIDTQQQRVIYTRHQNLLSNVVQQAFTTGISSNLLPNDYDSKEPTLSPDASQLAFTLFRFDALGDVCLLPLVETLETDIKTDTDTEKTTQSQPVNCITQKGSQEWQPFWVNNQTLGYLRRGFNQTSTELILHSLTDNTQQRLLSGKISAPAASPDGQWLIYHREGDASKRNKAVKPSGLYFYNLAKQQEIGPVQLDLSGNSSFARFDPQQQFIYFSHYLNDTNNDQKIDAQDHSVLFRLPLKQALDTSQKHLPEQLTSVAQNCSFPALTHEQVYMTCAFEGSLDTYRMPLTGQVPAQWQTTEINLAHAQASRYEERLLLLNTLRYRQKTHQQSANSPEFLERLLSNHLALNEFTAAGYYIKQLIQAYQSQPDVTEFFQNLATLLQLQAQQRLQPQGLLTASFRQQLQEAQQALTANTRNPENKALFNAWISHLLAEPAAAKRALAKTNANALHPLQIYLQLELANQLLANDPVALEKLLAKILVTNNQSTVTKMPAEARLFYAFQWLKQLNHPSLALSTAQQQQRLQTMANRTQDERVKILLFNEIDLLQLVAATELNEERRYFTNISKRLTPAKDDAQLRRLAHLRAIQLTGLAEKYNFMELMSRHWLTHTQISDPGFAQTAEYYSSINLSRAYGSLQQQENMTALNTFYALIRQTADPEAIYQLINLGLELDESLKPRMELLLNQVMAEDLIDRNDPLVATTLALFQTPDISLERLEALAKNLQGYQPKGLNRGAADLLTGSLYHRLLLKTQGGYSHNRHYYQQAHYHYMLGLDLAWNNPRSQAALLNNLGNLHLSVRNYGLASEFFTLRLQLPFITAEQQRLTHWQLANSLFYSNRMQAASHQAELALTLSQQTSKTDQLIAIEKAGFYALQAENFPLALKHYEALLKTKALSGLNLTKAEFSLAYLHFKLGNHAPAEAGFKRVLTQLPSLNAVTFKVGDQPRFSPQRLSLQSYGFLAQIAATPEEQLSWLEKRMQLLADLKIKDLRYGFDEESRLSQLIQAQLQAAVLLEKLQRPEQLAKQMQTNLISLEAWQKNGGSVTSQPVLQSVYNYLVLAMSHPTAFAKEPKALPKLLKTIHNEWVVEPETPAYNQAQQLKLSLLTAGYKFGLQQLTRPELTSELKTLQTEANWQGLAVTRPDLHQTLQALTAGLLIQAKP